MAEYYTQRASSRLIIAEATNISPQGRGYALTPGLYNEPQGAGWRQVTQALRGRGGRIFPQLWRVGRLAPLPAAGEAPPVAPSAIRPEATSYTAAGFQPCVTPRALETAEIPQVVEQYRQAARNALAASFDGVEIHAANGYLIEQFPRDGANRRTDAHGGSVENRARRLLEAAAAVAGVCGGERVGVRLSPVAPVNGAGLDSDPAGTYLHAVERLNAYGLAYILVIEGATQGTARGSRRVRPPEPAAGVQRALHG